MLDHLATFNLFKNTGFSSSFFWPLLNDLYWALFGLTFLLAFFFLHSHNGDSTGYFGSSFVVYFASFLWGFQTPLMVLEEMGDSLLSEPTLAAEPTPSLAAASPTPAAAEPGVSLAPPTSTAAATSTGAANVDLLGGQWASRKFSTKESLWEAQL